MRLAYFYVTDIGKEIAERLQGKLSGDLYGKEALKARIGEAFEEYDGLVLIMAAGIAVRMIAPFLVHKACDPAVVVMDQRGQFAISLVSGHLGGANELAGVLADVTGGTAVITTATDVENCVAFDVFAREMGMAVENMGELKYINGASQAREKVCLVLGEFWGIWDAFVKRHRECDFSNFIYSDQLGMGCNVVVDDKERADMSWIDRHVLYLRPRIYSVGIGCKRGIAYEDLYKAVDDLLGEYRISWLCVKNLATIAMKSQESAILELSQRSGIPLCIVGEESIKELDMGELGIQTSGFVEQVTGVPSVSTACSYMASGKGEILADKVRFSGITLALSVARSREL